MKLISSKKTKRRIALLFVFAFMLSNLLSLVGPSAQAVPTVTGSSTTGTCFQQLGTVGSGSLVTVYSIGSITISSLVSDIQPGNDASGVGTANGATARATNSSSAANGGRISTAGDVIGNVIQIVPPTNTNFVVIPGFQDTTGTGSSNLIASSQVSLTGAQSTDASTGGSDSNLAVSVGVVTQGTVGVGRAIIAIAKDADTTTSFAGSESYPKSGTGNNTATLSINGLGIAIPPVGSSATLSGTLTVSFDKTPPSGIQLIANGNTATIQTAYPTLGSPTITVCTITNPLGELEAVLDTDNDTNDLYDKITASANLLPLGQIGTLTRVHVLDKATTTASTATADVGAVAGAVVDIEPILIRGKAGTSPNTRDQVFQTGRLASEIDSSAETPAATGLTLTDTTIFTLPSTTTPITVSFFDDNSTAITTLNAVSISISNTTAGNPPTQAGFSATQNARAGFLGALRAGVHEGSNATSTAVAADGTFWGVTSLSGGTSADTLVQETHIAGATDSGGVSTLGGVAGNNTLEPFNNAIVDLRIFCTSATNPVAGWFATLQSNNAFNFGTTAASTQRVQKTQAGNLLTVTTGGGSASFFTQALTNIAGTTSTTGIDTNAATWRAGKATTDSSNPNNALLYASCSTDGSVTILPIQNAFDDSRDIIAITPRLTVTNITNAFTSDINISAQISGNNLSGVTELMLAKLLGVPATGQDSTLAAAQGVALGADQELGVDCSSGGTSTITLANISTGTVDAAVLAACTSGAIAPAGPLFTGGTGTTLSGTTVVKGTPTVQGEGRGILVKELNATGFSELVNQVGGGTQGTVFEIALPSGCDVIDDQDDNNTASSTSTTAGALGGNDVTRITGTSTAGIGVQFTGGATDAALSNANVLEPAAGSTPAKVRFGLTMATGTSTDAATTDAALIRFDSQDLLCPSTVTDLTATVTAQNKVTASTITAKLGMASLGTPKQAVEFKFADETVMSAKGETSTNMGILATPRLAGGSAGTSHTFRITELDPNGLPIGGRVSARSVEPENNMSFTVLSRGQIWITPDQNSAFTAAPALADVSFTKADGTADISLVIDGSPLLVTGSTVDANAPIGTLIIGIKDNTASSAPDPATTATTITVKNLQVAGASASTGPLTASAQFFSQDAGTVINTPGASSANSASTPTAFTPFVQGGTKARTQLEAAGVQINGSVALQQLAGRLTALGTPQLNPFAKTITAIQPTDANKISAAAAALTAGTPATDNVVTLTGAVGAVQGGAQVDVNSGSGYDTVTVTAGDDGSFSALVRGDCATAMSVSVAVTAKVSGTSATSVTKTATCGGGGGCDAACTFTQIAGTDGKVDLSEVLSFITGKGGLAAIVSAGGDTLAGVINAAKSALGLS